MEELNGTRIDAIVAFFNLFSEKLSLEECKTLLHTQYLLHTVVHFIKTGALVYQDHGNFGFYETVEFLVEQLDKSWTSSLHPDLAEDGDCKEVAKILVVLIYNVRLAWAEDLAKFVGELPYNLNTELANIVKFLDEQEYRCTINSLSSELLTRILTHRSPTPSQSSRDSVESAATLTDKFTSPLAHFGTRNFEDSQSSFMTAKSFLARDDALQGFDSGSPINTVLNSPRGTNVTKIKKQQRTINELKDTLETCGRERDHFEELSCQLREQLGCANVKVFSLESRCAALRAETEQLKLVEEKHIHLLAEHTDNLAKLMAMEVEKDEFQVLKRQLSFDRKDALERLDCVASQNVTLSEQIESLRTQLRDELEMHNFTRESLTKVVRDMNESDISFQRKIRDLEGELSSLAKKFYLQVQQKDDEIRREMEFSSQIRDNYVRKIKLLEKELLKACSKNSIDILKKLLKSVENDNFEMMEPLQRSDLPDKDDHLYQSRSLCELAQQKAHIENKNDELALQIQGTYRAKVNELEAQLKERSNMIFELCSQNKSLEMLRMQNQYISNRRSPFVINKNSDLKMLEDAGDREVCTSTSDFQVSHRCGAGGDAIEPIIEEPMDTSLNFSTVADGDVRIEVAEEVDEDIESLVPDEDEELKRKKSGIGSKLICGGIFLLSMTMAVLFGAYAFLLTAEKVYKNTKNSTEDAMYKKAN